MQSFDFQLVTQLTTTHYLV